MGYKRVAVRKKKKKGEVGEWGGGGGYVHSAQFGEPDITLVICLFRALSVGLEVVSRRRTSCLFEGGRVKRRGMCVEEDMFSVRMLNGLAFSKVEAGGNIGG